MALSFTEEKEQWGWDAFIAGNGGDFLQSWAWGELQGADGAPAWRFSLSRRDELIGKFQAYPQKTRIGAYLYIPRGPVFKTGQTLTADEQKEFAAFLKTLSPDCIFILCEPLREGDLNGFPGFKNLQPRKTLIVDLTKTTEQLQKDIVYSRRQGMRFAEKKGVRISHAASPEYLATFNALIQKTGARQGFGTFDAGHYQNIVRHMPAELFVARQDTEPLAAAEVIFWENTATYLHAGSDDANKKMRAPDLLIWTIIQESKRRGLTRFDFWGVDERRWPGVTAFKKSFGGYEYAYPEARIIVNKPLSFIIYRALKALRSLIKMVY